jgi:excisionase family DNA binding protein
MPRLELTEELEKRLERIVRFLQWKGEKDLGLHALIRREIEAACTRHEEEMAFNVRGEFIGRPATVEKLEPEKPTPSSDNDRGRLTMKVPEAAEMLGVNAQSVRRLIDRGEIKAIRSLRHPLIPVSEIQRFIDKSRQG